MTHKDLVNAAYRWVLNNTSCGVAFREVYTNCNEYPDVIGFASWNYSVLIECKASRSDFLADRKKPFRQDPQQGMGRYRFYCCPNGLIKQTDLPENWGLIYVSDKGRARCVHNPYNNNGGKWANIWNEGFQQNITAERSYLYSCMRRLFKRGLTDAVYLPESAVFSLPISDLPVPPILEPDDLLRSLSTKSD